MIGRDHEMLQETGIETDNFRTGNLSLSVDVARQLQDFRLTHDHSPTSRTHGVVKRSLNRRENSLTHRSLMDRNSQYLISALTYVVFRVTPSNCSLCRRRSWRGRPRCGGRAASRVVCRDVSRSYSERPEWLGFLCRREQLFSSVWTR
jgi:hypothetical protein